MASRRITLVFPQNLIKEPVVFTMAKAYNVAPNIRRARVTETAGEMTLELEGDDKTLDQAIQFLKDKGIKVESAVGDNVI
jgi:L-aspartate semialdehyde sulfurtransferase ferredoxin